MRETLKMMKSIIEGYETTKSINELLQEYQQTQSSNILAYVFVQNYPLLIEFKNKYFELDEDDLVSYILEELDNAMMKFDFDRQVGFITFFYNCLKNRLYVECKKLKTNSQVANYYVTDLAEYVELEDIDFSFDSLNDYNLTKEQYELCNYIIDGYTVREIAKKINLSHTMVYNKIKNLRKVFC